MAWAGRDIAKIPSAGFEWYIYLLEDHLSDDIRDQVKANFEKLGQAVGEDALVVRGYDPMTFNKQVHEAYQGVYKAVGAIDPPALLVSDTAPSKLKEAGEAARVMVFQLQSLAAKHGSVANFLAKLIKTLRDPAAMAALVSREPGPMRQAWGWLGDYVKMEPKLFGCSLNINKAIGDALTAGDRLLGR